MMISSSASSIGGSERTRPGSTTSSAMRLMTISTDEKSSDNFVSTGGSRLKTALGLPKWASHKGDCVRSTSSLRSRPASAPAMRGGDSLYGGRKWQMPGYTGYIRHKQHVAGRTFGKMTARAENNSTWKLVTGDTIPTHPAATRKHDKGLSLSLSTSSLSSTVVTGAEARPKHVPGYTGHVPRVRHVYGKSYGPMTSMSVRRNLVQKRDRRLLNEQGLKLYSTMSTRHTRSSPKLTCDLPGVRR